MKVSDIIAFGALVLTALIYMNVGRKPVVWLLLIIGFGALAVSVASRTKSKSGTSTTTQTATASDGSTVNQAGHDIVINNLASSDTIPGTKITEKNLREVFPFGYAIFSFRDGRWTYSPLPSDKMQWSADWENLQIIPDFSAK